MATTADNSWFGIFPAQADYDNTPQEQRAALHSLLPYAKTKHVLTELAVTLGIIGPAQPEEAAEEQPAVCDAGHRLDRHGFATSAGTTRCNVCAAGRATQREAIDPTGAMRRLRHLILNGHTLRVLADMIGVSANTIGGLAHGRRRTVAQDLHDRIAAVFDKHRDDYHPQRYHAVAAQSRADWVWAELYEDLDDPDCEPVMPKAVAA